MRARRLLLGGAGVVLAAGLTVGGILLVGASRGAEDQQGVLAGLISRALSTSAGQVHIGAVDGALSSDATIRDVVLSDRDGVWLRLDRARIRWRRAALLLRRLEVERLEIGHLEILRRKVPSDKPKPLLPDLPVKLEIKAFDLADLDLGAPVLGVAMRAAATGDTVLGSPSEGLAFHLDGTRLDSPGHFLAAIAYVPKGNALGVKVKLDEPAGGLVSRLAHLPDAPPVKLDLSGDGTLDAFAGTIDFVAGPRIDAKGKVTLQREGAGRTLATRVAGHLGAMLPALAAPIFEGQTDLSSDVRFEDDGAVSLDSATLRSHLARLDAKGTLTTDKVMDFKAAVRAVPNAGEVSAVGASSIRTLVFDASVAGPIKAPRIGAALVLADARTAAGTFGRLDAHFNATPSGAVDDAATRIALDGSIEAAGIAPHDAALAEAIGGHASARLRGSADPRGHVRLDEVSARTPTANLAFTGDVARERIAGRLFAKAPDLTRLAGVAGRKLAGRVELTADLDAQPSESVASLALSGRGTDVATGVAAVDGLTGRGGALKGRLVRDHDAYHIDGLALEAAHLSARLSGTASDHAADLAATVDLPDLAHADARLAGRGRLDAHLTGSLQAPDLAVTAALDDARAIGRPIPHLALDVVAHDLRRHPTLNATLDGRVDDKLARGRIAASGAPEAGSWKLEALDVAVGATRMQGSGAYAQRRAQGELHLATAELDDLSALALTKLGGSLRIDARLDAPDGRQDVHIVGQGRDLKAAGASVRKLDLAIDGKDVLSRPVLDADATIDQAQVGKQTISNVKLVAKGSPASSAIQLSAKAAGFDLAAAGALIPTGQPRFDLTRFSARRDAHHIDLAGPASFAMADGGVDIRRLALAIAGGRLTLDGHAGKMLALKLDAQAVPLAAADIAVPGLGLSGTLDAAAKVDGPAAAPAGNYALALHKVSAPQAHNAGVPPIDVAVSGKLAGKRASLDAKIVAGRGGTLTAAGSLPLDPAGTIDLGVRGSLQAAMANTVLGPGGRTVSGILTVDAKLAGTKVAPKLSGGVTMAGGTFRDALIGVRLDDIGLKVAAQGDRVSIERLVARTPNGGTIDGSGQVRLDPAAGFPGSVSLRGSHASLADGSLMNATADLAVDVSGALACAPKVHGRVDVTHVDVGIPDRMPSTLRPIDGITHVNATPEAATRLALVEKKSKARQGTKGRAALFEAALDLTIAAPNRIFVRGRGVDAELGGDLHVTGTTNKPTVNGGFEMHTGKLLALGKTMTFTKGKLTFTGDMVPEVDFAAEIAANDLTAQIAVTGPAAAPTFAFTSSPSLPQDEILSRVLFNKPSGSLSGFQALQLAQTAAQFSSGGDGAFEKLRKSLGVDSLDLGSSSNGGPSVGVSRAISDRVRVGVQTGATADQTGLSADVDVTRHVRVQSQVDSRGSTSMGVGSEFEY